MKSLVNFYSLIKVYYFPASGHAFYKERKRRVGLFFTILLLLIKAKFSNEKEVKVRLFGFEVSANSPQTLLLLVKEIFIDQVYHFHASHPAPKIIDAGANVGISVLYFKSLYPNAQIIAIEPNPMALQYLEKNISQNFLEGVRVEKACISDKVGKEKFYYSNKINIANASLFAEIGKDYLMEVDSLLLSDFLSEDVYDLVKIDIEGAERQVLKELKTSGKLQKSKRYIIEYHYAPDYLKDSLQEIQETFSEAGFSSRITGDDRDKLLNFEYSPYFGGKKL
ncbi:FkbM family methyltransferase [Aquiflexum sp. TKW24L]|uniref:FkbM family methyltransferase n=1 Tax=Aquiflexum sp. TKW24L TaxID=2942212 RepID=UPI0020BD7F18|nr:FkbM family methyltransferase [Aquiflexum sp. TKW24L]MCL6261220.1 FkbM family methyltransferase [Aquiflexum sp. TKW24L]